MNQAIAAGCALAGNVGTTRSQPGSSPLSVNWNAGSRCALPTFTAKSVRYVRRCRTRPGVTPNLAAASPVLSAVARRSPVRRRVFVDARCAEYPPALTLDAPRQVRTTAATSEEIAALHRAALTLGEKWGTALTVLVDLIYGAGARPAELKHLRRGDIRIERHHGQRWVVVTLQTATSTPRDVPIIDSQIGQRLEHYIATARHDRLLAFGAAPTVERNGINRVNERLAERGLPERLNAQALRHAWMKDLVQVLPVSEFCYLSGVTSLNHMHYLGAIVNTTGDIDAITGYFVEDSK